MYGHSVLLLWRVLDGLHDALAGTPDAIRTGTMIAFAVGIFVAWAWVSSRIPKLGLVLNIAIIALVIVEVLAARGAPPLGDYAQGQQALGVFNALFVAGEALLSILGGAGAILAITRLVENRPLLRPRAPRLHRKRFSTITAPVRCSGRLAPSLSCSRTRPSCLSFTSNKKASTKASLRRSCSRTRPSCLSCTSSSRASPRAAPSP